MVFSILCKLSYEEKSNWLRSNPVIAARHFHYRLISLQTKCVFQKCTDKQVADELNSKPEVPLMHTV